MPAHHLERMWINQPSSLQPLHKLHGTNVIADLEEELHSNAITIYFLAGSVISQRCTKNCLSSGWINRTLTF